VAEYPPPCDTKADATPPLRRPEAGSRESAEPTIDNARLRAAPDPASIAGVEPRHLLATDVRAYATLAVRLAEPDCDRAAILAENDLDEDAWDALDDQWQARLSAAVDEIGEDDSVPLLVKEHADAFAAAQAARVRPGPPLSFERFVEITHEIQRGHDIQHVLKRSGTTLHDYLRAEQHWLHVMMDDPALQERFHRAMSRRA